MAVRARIDSLDDRLGVRSIVRLDGGRFGGRGRTENGGGRRESMQICSLC